jgi:DNA repair protein RecO (recombination protein O)
VAEPGLFATANALLDALDAPLAEPSSAEALLATAGVRMLADIGFGLVLDRCVRCGKPCAPEATACLDAQAGGLVCRACGGARLVVRSALRARIEAAAAGDDVAIVAEDARIVVDLVEAALVAHAAPTR